jgi:hypothetical protein
MEQGTTTTTATDRPASMDAALASVEASPASTPAADAQTSATPAATATTSPEGTEAAQVEPGTDGTGKKGVRLPDGTYAPPEARWPDILENQRAKAAEESAKKTREEVEAQYAGLKDFSTLDAQERAGLLVWHKAMAGDAQSRAMVAQVQPQLAQSLGWVKATAEEPEPQFMVDIGEGRAAFDPDLFAKWREWNDRRLTTAIRQEVGKDLGPVREVISAHNEAKAHATVATVLTEMRADPDFKAHEKDVVKTLQGDPWLWNLADSDPGRALKIAYADVYRNVVVPAREKASSESAEAKVLTNLQSRAVAGTTNPASAATATPHRPRSMAEALEQVGA